MTTDGARNEKGAAEDVVGVDDSFHCAAHAIQLCVRDVMKSDESTAFSCSQQAIATFVKAARNSHAAQRAFRKAKLVSLLKSVPTRWDADFIMMQRLCRLKWDLCRLNSRNPDLFDFFPAEQHFALADSWCKIFYPVRRFTLKVQRKRSPTFCYLLFWLDKLVGQLEEIAKQFAHLKPFIDALTNFILKRFKWASQPDSLAWAASYIVPGLDVLNLKYFTAPPEESIQEKLSKEAAELLQNEFADSGFISLIRAGLSFWKPRLKAASEKTDVLKWWKSQTHLGHLKPLILMLLAIPAASAENERVFSAAGHLLRKKRLHLGTKAFREEILIRSFLSESKANYHWLMDTFNDPERLKEEEEAEVASGVHMD